MPLYLMVITQYYHTVNIESSTRDTRMKEYIDRETGEIVRLPRAPKVPKNRRVMVKTHWHTAAETRYINASRRRARNHLAALLVALAVLGVVLLLGGSR